MVLRRNACDEGGRFLEDNSVLRLICTLCSFSFYGYIHPYLIYKEIARLVKHKNCIASLKAPTVGISPPERDRVLRRFPIMSDIYFML